MALKPKHSTRMSLTQKCLILAVCVFLFYVAFSYFEFTKTTSNLVKQLKNKLDASPSLNVRLFNESVQNKKKIAKRNEDNMSTTTPIIPANYRPNKTILLWNRLPGVMNSFLGTGRDGFLRYGCEVTDCHVEDGQQQQQNNRSMDSYDAVVFNMNVVHYSGVLPWTTSSYSRSPKQRFVFFSQEPPMYTWGGTGFVNKTEVNLYANYFNLSMTYRNDADVHLFYGSFKPNQLTNFSSPSTTADATSNATIVLKRNATTAAAVNESIVAWMVSHCPTEGRREDYVKELKRHIGVDSYGACGNLSCEKDNGANGSSKKCFDLIESKYKFYLSFENSICTDYVTEKFFQIMTLNVVPIVYGGADYSRIAPPHSYIDARQFQGPKQLADYLLLLDKNDYLYNAYFAWKEKYAAVAGQESMVLSGFCNLCRKLHQDNSNESSKVYTQLVNHWLPEHQCKPPKTYSSK